MESSVINSINQVITDMMDKVMEKVLIIDPFIPEKHHASKPLYAALVPDEIFKGSHFERRFVTPFGNAWEKLAVAAGNAYHGHCGQGVDVEGTVGEDYLKLPEFFLN